MGGAATVHHMAASLIGVILRDNYTRPAVIRPSPALGSCSLASAAATVFPVISEAAPRRAGLTLGGGGI